MIQSVTIRNFKRLEDVTIPLAEFRNSGDTALEIPNSGDTNSGTPIPGTPIPGTPHLSRNSGDTALISWHDLSSSVRLPAMAPCKSRRPGLCAPQRRWRRTR